jgi:hypothetical protein
MSRKFHIVLLGLAIASSSPVFALDDGVKAGASSATVPLTIKTVSGHRPFIEIRLNGHSYSMMVHSNARFYMEISHAMAEQVGVKNVRHAGAFGIEAAGKVSPLGRDEATVDRLNIGSGELRDVPVSVFETPTPTIGMLGLDWIRANRIVVDYAQREVRVNPTPEQTSRMRTALLSRGYVAVPMHISSEGGYYMVDVHLGSATRSMVVSTVAELFIDTDFAKVAGVEQGKVSGQYGGPKGATGNSYHTAKPVRISIGDWQSAPIKNAAIEDIYAYENEQRPADDASGGMLGADVLLAAGSVVDFGNRTLYLKK